MSGKRQNQHSFERMRDKQAARRPRHTDKYADRAGEAKFDSLVRRFNGEEAEND